MVDKLNSQPFAGRWQFSMGEFLMGITRFGITIGSYRSSLSPSPFSNHFALIAYAAGVLTFGGAVGRIFWGSKHGTRCGLLAATGILIMMWLTI